MIFLVSRKYDLPGIQTILLGARSNLPGIQPNLLGIQPDLLGLQNKKCFRSIAARSRFKTSRVVSPTVRRDAIVRHVLGHVICQSPFYESQPWRKPSRIAVYFHRFSIISIPN